MIEKFPVTVGASRAKKHRCKPEASMRFLKKAAHKALRRSYKNGNKEFFPVTSWDIV